MKEGHRFLEHLKRIEELTDQLAATGAGIEEEEQTATLLGNLPPSYAPIVTGNTDSCQSDTAACSESADK